MKLRNKKTLTDEMRDIRQFARFGLLEFSDHAMDRLHERNIKADQLVHMIQLAGSTISQNRKPNKQRNEFERFVVNVKNKSQKYHAVIQKEIAPHGGINYRIITAYEPSSQFFRNDGSLKKRIERTRIAPTH